MVERLLEVFATESFSVALGVLTASYLVWTLVFWRVRRRRALQERLEDLRHEIRSVQDLYDHRYDEDQPGSDEDEAEILREGPSSSVAWELELQMEQLQTRIGSLETRMDNLRSDFDVVGKLRRRASERPILTVLIASAATIVATVLGSLLSTLLLQRLLPPA